MIKYDKIDVFQPTKKVIGALKFIRNSRNMKKSNFKKLKVLKPTSKTIFIRMTCWASLLMISFDINIILVFSIWVPGTTVKGHHESKPI
jgi:hypothetical protein